MFHGRGPHVMHSRHRCCSLVGTEASAYAAGAGQRPRPARLPRGPAAVRALSLVVFGLLLPLLAPAIGIARAEADPEINGDHVFFRGGTGSADIWSYSISNVSALSWRVRTREPGSRR